MSEFVDALRHNQLSKVFSWALHGVMAPKVRHHSLILSLFMAKLTGMACLTFGAAASQS